MAVEYRVWFTNINGCAVGIGDISWFITVSAASEAEALELALVQARSLNERTGMPPHRLRCSEAELRYLAVVIPSAYTGGLP